MLISMFFKKTEIKMTDAEIKKSKSSQSLFCLSSAENGTRAAPVRHHSSQQSSCDVCIMHDSCVKTVKGEIGYATNNGEQVNITYVYMCVSVHVCVCLIS